MVEEILDTDEAENIKKSASPRPALQEKPKTSGDIQQDEEDNSKGNIFESLFANGNTLVTAEKGELAIDSETRRMVALFSDGTYLVDAAHRFDGKVLNFTSIARRRKFTIFPPEYVSAQEIAAIYAYAERGMGQIDISPEETEEYQMQIDFLSVINRAAAKKVSDVHIVVADSTLVMFRMAGMMERELEYSKEWGEAFVRAAFASADISDANYAQNEFQGAQK